MTSDRFLRASCALTMALGLGLPALAQTPINLGTNPNDGTGDNLRTAFTKINSNFTGTLQKANNLSDVASPATARINLGLGTASTQPSTAFDVAGAAAAITAASLGAATTGALSIETTRAQTAEGLAAQKASNLSDLASPATARANLGLGSAAITASTAYDPAGAAASAQTAAVQAAALAAPALAPVQKVAGRTGAIVLMAADIGGLGSAALQPSSAFDAAGAGATAATTAMAAYLPALPKCTAGSPIAPVPAGSPFLCAGLVMIAQ